MTVCWMAQLVKYIDHPYKLDAGWPMHTEPAQVPRLVGLKFTPQANRFYSGAYRILQSNGFEEGDPVLAFYSLPGLVYAVGGTSVGRAWLSGIPGSADIVCRSLQNLKTRRMERLYFFVTDGPTANTIDCLKEAGIAFPDDCIKLGQVHNPYDRSGGVVDLYRLRSDHPLLHRSQER